MEEERQLYIQSVERKKICKFRILYPKQPSDMKQKYFQTNAQNLETLPPAGPH